MEKISFKPNKILATYIDRFYILKRSNEVAFNLPIVLPGTGLELLFHIDETLFVNKVKLAKSHIICPRKVFEFDKTKHVYFISVRFKSGAFRHFTSIPYLALNDTYLSVTTIWKSNGLELLDRLNDFRELSKKIALIESFLMKRLVENKKETTKKWDEVISTLYTKYNVINLQELATKTNLSYRQFERSFKKQFGITAKKFQRISRFQDTTKKILLAEKEYYLDEVLDNGFFDQSHFINEFQNFVKLKPSDYFIKNNFKNNFYCKPLI